MTIELNQKTNQALLALGNRQDARHIRKAITSTLEDVAVITRDSDGGVIGLSAGGAVIDVAAIAGGGYTRTLSGTVVYADGNTLISLGQPITGATMTISPQTGAAGIDYTADASPHVSTGEWIAVYGGNVDANASITFNGAITGIRIRPIASGADIDYVITAPGSNYYATDTIAFAGGNEVVTLPSPMAGVSAYVVGVTGEIGIDYTADASPDDATGNWTAVYGGNVADNSSVEFTANIMGLRFRPIASGAAATYIVRR